MNKKKKLLFFGVLVALVGIVFSITRPVQIPVNGLLRTDNGSPVSDGFYDLRVVGFDQATGAQTINQDFTDVYVSGGEYELPVSLNRFSSTGKSYLQICRSYEPTDNADGLSSDTPAGCKDAVEQQKTFTYAECPQTILINSAGGLGTVLGGREVSLQGQCIYTANASVTGVTIPLAPSTSANPSVETVSREQGLIAGTIVERGDQGETGVTGPQGPQGLQGESGVDGVQGIQGPAGDPATDDQTITFGGASILSISGGNSVDLSSLIDNTDELASLMCADGEVPLMTLGAWTCGVASGVDTDDQTLSLISNLLSIDNGNSLSLAGYLDNTDTQDISLVGNTLSLVAGGSVNLAAYLDNTDTQDISLLGNTLSLVAGGSVSLAPYLDNTDAQNLTLTVNTLSLSGDGTTVNLAGYMDNTDVLAGLSCGLNQIAKWNGSVWACAADNNLNESQVDAFVANNGYLTSEVDGSTTNELQNLTFASNVIGLTNSGTTFNLSSYLDNTDSQDMTLIGNTLSLTGDGTSVSLASYLDNTDAQSISVASNVLSISGNASTVNLAGYMDNTDVLASLSCTNGQVAQWNGISWVCANAGADTDDQTLSLLANNLAIDGGNSVSLATYLDNTDAQSISVNTNILSISGNAGTVDLSVYLDDTDTDTQDISLSGNTLSLIAGGSVNLSGYLDNTDNQDLTLTGNTLALTNDGTTINLAPYLDNTDVLASLSCLNNQIPKWNGAAWACAADVDTVLNEAQVDAYIANNGYLTSEVDGSTTNELQDLTFSSNTLGLTSSGVSFDLSAYLDNTDAQDMTLTGNTLALTGDGTSVSLATYLDNTDAQSISVNTNILSISGNAGTVDLSVYLDDTDTDTQDISLSGNTLSLIAGGSVNLSGYLDNTDNQDLTLTGNTLALTNDGTNVNLAAYLDNTDSQNLFLTIDAPNGTDPVADSAADTLAFADGAGITITGNSTTDTVTVAAVLGATIDSSAEIVDGIVDNADLVNSAVTITSGAGLTTGGSVSLGGSVTLDIGAGNGITVNANDIAVDLIVATDALSATTSSGSGLEVLASGVTIIQGCSDAQILKWNEATDVWACSADAGLTSEVDAVIGNEVTDITASGGLVRAGSGTGGSPYTLGVATGGVANTMLANSSLTITSGNGLTTGGSVSLGGTVTLDVGAGTGITVNANDVAITADGLNYTELSDSLSLDATTTTALGANNLITNLDSGGDFLIQDAGSTFLTIDDARNYTYTMDATNNPAYTITNAGSSNVITNLSGTGDYVIQDNGTTSFVVQDNGGVYIGDPASAAATGSMIILDSITVDPVAGTAGAMYYNSANSKFRCYQGSAWTDCISPWITIRKTSDQDVTNSSTYTDDTILQFTTTANTVYSVRFYICYTGTNATADYKGQFLSTTAATAVKNVSGRYIATTTADAIASSAGVLGSTTVFPSGGLAMGTATATTDKRIFEGFFSFQPATAGVIKYQFAQNTTTAAQSARTCANSFIEYQAI